MSERYAVVFAGLIDGPVPGIELLPPPRGGDVDVLLGRDRPPVAIGIVDGPVFHRTAVQAKEVLRALDHGVAVFGSSGVGALRAVECEPYGMVGVGRVFAEYRDGRIDGDDEVAGPEPLVNMRFALAAAIDAGVTTADHARRFLKIAAALHFPQRTTAAVLGALAAEVGAGDCAALARFLAEGAPDTMRDDAVALLDAIRRAVAGDRPGS